MHTQRIHKTPTLRDLNCAGQLPVGVQSITPVIGALAPVDLMLCSAGMHGAFYGHQQATTIRDAVDCPGKSLLTAPLNISSFGSSPPVA